MPKPLICLTPQVRGVGGMVSFRNKLESALAERGYRLTYNLDAPGIESVLVIGGTRDLAGLRRARARGARIVQRLDGMNWLHRRLKTGVRHFLRAEAGNLLLRRIRRGLAEGIIYQSEFCRAWWEREAGQTAAPHRIVYNGVNTRVYTPDGLHRRPNDQYRLLMVEGSLQGGYETGLETAIGLLERLNRMEGMSVRLAVAGRVAPEVQARYTGEPVDWLGLVAADDIPEIDRSAHALFSADLNAACPNAVIEALACGLPVAAFDTGALAELVDPDSGRIVPYGGNPWRLDPPDVAGLAEGVAEIFAAGDQLRQGARRRAQAHFNLEKMVTEYEEFLA